MFEYEGLDLRPLPVPPRSRLFDLEPVGVGTPHVESLTGYITRLAQAHCVSVAALFREIIVPAISSYKDFKNGEVFVGAGSGIISAMNGIGLTAASLTGVLETATSRKHLRFLTMLTWRDAVCYRYLIRRVSAWCPSCYEDGREQGLVYEPLLWSLSCVEVCAVHRRRLCSRCPHCGEQFRLLTSHTRPGLCSKCHRWLGNSASSPPGGELSDGDVNVQLRLVEDVGELLASAPIIDSPPRKGAVARALSLCIDRLTGGNAKKLADLVGLSENSLYGWKRGLCLPTLGSSVRLSQCLGFSTRRFLTDDIASAEFPVEPMIKQGGRIVRGRYSRLKIDWEYALRALRAAETEYPPPSIAEVANRMSAGKQSAKLFGGRLRRHYPDVCNAISVRYAEYQRVQTRGRLQELLEQSLVEFPPPSMGEVKHRITKLMGANIFVARYKPLRHFCHEISARHKNYMAEKRCGERRKIREEVRRAASALYAENSYPTINKVRAFLHMTAELSHVGRAALIEVRRELGIQ
jgi:hypothetical protein